MSRPIEEVPPRLDDGLGGTIRCPACGFTLRGVRLRGDCDFTLLCREKIRRTPDPCASDRRLRWERCGATLRIRRAGQIVSVTIEQPDVGPPLTSVGGR